LEKLIKNLPNIGRRGGVLDMNDAKDFNENLLQIITAEAINQNIRPDREAVDDLLIDAMAGELSNGRETISCLLWQNSSVPIEGIYSGVIKAIQAT
jgi:hypothetical protein